MKILITGGAGFIGSHISKLLLDTGHQVIVYDNLSNGFQDLVDARSTFIKGDIKDQQLLIKSLQGVDAVIHMASFAIVPDSIKDPMLYADNNILGAVSLLEAMRQAEVKKIIFSSSCTVYGFPDHLPIEENFPIFAASPYGATKIAVESFVQSYNLNNKFDVTILRYFNPFGPNEKHEPETHAVPNFIKSALKDEPIPLYWKGEQIRDFIYVEDLAAAHVAVLSLSGYNVFNVGTETGTKVIDIVNVIYKMLGEEPKIDDLGERFGDVQAVYASSKLLKEKTGWEAKYSLEEGLKKTIEWFKLNS